MVFGGNYINFLKLKKQKKIQNVYKDTPKWCPWERNSKLPYLIPKTLS